MFFTYRLKTLILCAGLTLLCQICYAENIVIYGGDSFDPQTYLDNGKPAGVIPALFARISKDTGDTYTFKLLPWKRAIAASAEGKGGIVSFTLNAERAKNYDFSEPTYQNKVRLMVLKENSFTFNTLADLNGLVVGFPLGSSFGDAFDTAVADKKIIAETDTNQVSRLKKLLLGRIDVAILGSSSFQKVVVTDPLLLANKDRFKTLPNPLLEDWLYLAFAKQMQMKPALERFNKSLSALKKSKEYDAIVSQYSH